MENQTPPLSAATASRFQLAFQQFGCKHVPVTQAHIDLINKSKFQSWASDEVTIIALKVQPPKTGLSGLASLFVSKEDVSLYYTGSKDAKGDWVWMMTDGQVFITNRRIFFFNRLDSRTVPGGFDNVEEVSLSLLKGASIERNVIVLFRNNTDRELHLSLHLPQASVATNYLSIGLGAETADDRWAADRSSRDVSRLKNQQANVLSTFVDLFTLIGNENAARAKKATDPTPSKEILELLEKLNQLKAAGVLTEEEFQVKKQGILSRL